MMTIMISSYKIRNQRYHMRPKVL